MDWMVRAKTLAGEVSFLSSEMSRINLGLIQPPVQWLWLSFPGCKMAGV